jgi:hypothetical protein
VIQFNINAARVAELAHGVHIGNEIMGNMRMAGMPIFGALWPVGVEQGYLHMRIDAMFDEITWTLCDDGLPEVQGIEVVIDSERIAKARTSIDLGMDVLKRLRAAGIPAEGHLWPQKVESGVLHMRFDAMFGDQVWTWEQ